MADVSVQGEGGGDYRVRVIGRTEHLVHAEPDVLARVSRPEESPEACIERAFHFLLEREPPESILRSFTLQDIARYFPEFWDAMR